MGNLQLPIGGPATWDKVIDTPASTVAIAFTAGGRKKMYEKGWMDAVDKKEPRFDNDYYISGYRQGSIDIVDEKLGDTNQSNRAFLDPIEP